MRWKAAHSQLILTLFAVAGSNFWAVRPCFGSHSAFVNVAHDPFGFAPFAGTSTPSGVYQINLASGAPGYLNGIAGGQSGGSDGMVTVTALGKGTVYLMGLAIHVTDTAGTSHSLSSLGDPALGDIINDLNHPPFGGEIVPTAYAYNAAPAQYAAAESILSAGESANGGQPFDIPFGGNGPRQHYAALLLVPEFFQRSRQPRRHHGAHHHRRGRDSRAGGGHAGNACRPGSAYAAAVLRANA
jgi:hypothetical protein